jgi:hypothetical protein
LVSLAVLTALKGQPDNVGWPTIDKVDYSSYQGRTTVVDFGIDGLLSIGGSDILAERSEQLDAAVSLCRIGRLEGKLSASQHLPIMLMDHAGEEHNPNLEFCLDNAATALNTFLGAGHRTALHCVQAQSRTPSVLALALMQSSGLTSTDALNEATGALPDAHPNVAFQAALAKFDGLSPKRYATTHGLLTQGEMHVHTNFGGEICALTLDIPEGVFERQGGAWIFAGQQETDVECSSSIHSLSSSPIVIEQSLSLVGLCDEYQFAKNAVS